MGLFAIKISELAIGMTKTWFQLVNLQGELAGEIQVAIYWKQEHLDL